jgi:hypothetical protein
MRLSRPIRRCSRPHRELSAAIEGFAMPVFRSEKILTRHLPSPTHSREAASTTLKAPLMPPVRVTGHSVPFPRSDELDLTAKVPNSRKRTTAQALLP